MFSSKTGYFRFKIAGIWITLDYLLPLSVVVIGWVLSARYFPAVVYLTDSMNYWILGFLGSFSLLFSILFHEVGHALAAKVLRIPIERIHVYLFGGMAELRHRPLIPNQEFFVSMAGPIASSLLALVSFVILSRLHAQTQALFYFIVHFVAYMNLLLALFNLIPVYPLDGGRAVRAIIWRSKKNYFKASQLMHRLSSGLIAVIFIISLILFFFVDGYYAFWLGIFGLYVAYLLMKAKTELTGLPQFSELIFTLPEHATPAEIIQKILTVNPDALKKSIVPVMIQGDWISIIRGNQLMAKLTEEFKFSELTEPILEGMHINTKSKDTFSTEVNYQAEFIPVFEGPRFLGLCDAYEMRFWLQQSTYLQHESTELSI